MDLEATAPEQPEVHADANVDGRSVYALVLTVADRGDPVTFGNIANGTVSLYFDTGATLSLVNQAIISIELKEAQRIAGLAAPWSSSKTKEPSSPSTRAPMPTTPTHQDGANTRR